MRINANVMAVNTHRQLFGSQNAGAKAMEKLSSGFRINRASDDAAGLAISEKMRSQIRGMRQASRNAQDGISVVQTAEGALDEIHSMLQRMKELSVQSANDSNQSAVDREALQLEVNQLYDEINSITEKTQFNKMTLLDGSFQGKKFHVGANSNETIGISIKEMTASGLGLTKTGVEQIQSGDPKVKTAATAAKFTSKEAWVDLVAGDKTSFTVNINGKSFDFSMDGNVATERTAEDAARLINEQIKGHGVAVVAAGKVEITSAVQGAESSVSVNVVTTSAAGKGFKVAAGVAAGEASVGKAATYEEATAATLNNTGAVSTVAGTAQTVTFQLNGERIDVQYEVGDDLNKIVAKTNAAFGGRATMAADGKSITTTDKGKFANVAVLEVKGGAGSGFDNTNALGKKAGTVVSGTDPENGTKSAQFKGVNILTREGANEGMKNIQSAIEELASRRAELGATQNRIEHTIKNLDNSHENLMAAESRVRHVDMALEIIEQTRNNILQQASTAMLAQANQAPQSVLSLLR